MLMELSVLPLGGGVSLSGELAKLVKMIDDSGLDYRLTPTGTIVEGELESLLALAEKCHQAARQTSGRVITTIKLDDYEGRTGRLTSAIQSVESKVGKKVKK